MASEADWAISHIPIIPFHRTWLTRLLPSSSVLARWNRGRREKFKAISQNFLDHPSTMSMCEKESLAAEAKLRVRKPAGKNRKSQLGLASSRMNAHA